MSVDLDVLARLFGSVVGDALAQLDGDLPSNAPDDVDADTLTAYRDLCGALRAAVLGASTTLASGFPVGGPEGSTPAAPKPAGYWPRIIPTGALDIECRRVGRKHDRTFPDGTTRTGYSVQASWLTTPGGERVHGTSPVGFVVRSYYGPTGEPDGWEVRHPESGALVMSSAYVTVGRGLDDALWTWAQRLGKEEA